MSQPFEERYYNSTYERRLDAARDALSDIQSNAGYALHDIERGRIPQMRSMLDDALKLARTIAAMEAAAELREVYDSAKKEA